MTQPNQSSRLQMEVILWPDGQVPIPMGCMILPFINSTVTEINRVI